MTDHLRRALQFLNRHRSLMSAVGLVVLLITYACVQKGSMRTLEILIALVVFLVIWLLFWWLNQGARCFYFDAQDFLKYENGGGRELPVSADTGTFAPLLDHYIGVTKLTVVVAAASISFGGNQRALEGVYAAKLFLAFSILYGVLFCAFLLYRYDEYTQNVRCYTKFWYSTVETLGFSALTCFILGYVVWALTLG